MKTKYFFIVSTLLTTLTSGAAMAQQNTVKLGYASVQPNSSASNVTGPFTPTGLSLEVRNASTPVFSYVREINDRWDAEFCVGVPPTHDVNITINNPALPASAQALNGQIGARVRQVAPTLFVNYKFLEKSSALRPFVGVGINYTRFDKATSTAANDALNGGATSLSLKDSVGLALQAGVVYRFDNQWSVTAALGTAQVKTKLTSNTLGIVRTADIKFRPAVLAVSVGYSF